MYYKATSHPAPTAILHTADWQKTKHADTLGIPTQHQHHKYKEYKIFASESPKLSAYTYKTVFNKLHYDTIHTTHSITNHSTPMIVI